MPHMFILCWKNVAAEQTSSVVKTHTESSESKYQTFPSVYNKGAQFFDDFLFSILISPLVFVFLYGLTL